MKPDGHAFFLLIGDKQSALAHSRSTDIEIFKGRKMRACLSLRSVGTLKTK